MSPIDSSRLTRSRQPMPDYIRKVLVESGLLSAYQARPAYQQNDYLGWINRAIRPDTRFKRLTQMLHELKQGNVYMNMPHHPNRKDR